MRTVHVIAGVLALLGGPMSATALAQTPVKTILNPPELPDTTQYGYSQATVVTPGARTVYVAGQVGFLQEGPNDFESQVDRAFANLIAVLTAAGASPADVVKITVLIKDHDPSRLAYLGAKRREVFGSSPPASTLIPVTLLYAEGVSFEIDAIAVVADSSSPPSPGR